VWLLGRLVTATLTYPDGSTKLLSLPDSVAALPVGDYSIEVVISAQGYKTQLITKEFKVAAEVVDVVSGDEVVDVCNLDNICDEGEDSVNCPQDCYREDVPKKRKINAKVFASWQDDESGGWGNRWIYGVVFAIILLVIIFVIVYFIKRKNRRRLSS